MEEGELSDEDEETRKERLKPQPVCRFYNKGDEINLLFDIFQSLLV